MDLCGIVVQPSRLWAIKNFFKVANPNGLVFCSSSNFEMLNKTFEQKIEVLVIGNGDYDFSPSELVALKGKAGKIYVQNLDYEMEGIDVLPIGIENLRLGRNGRKSLMRNTLSWREKFDKVLIGPFSDTHAERGELNGFVNTSGPWDSYRGFMSEVDYAALSRKYKYVACPRGNGLDTHRFWETLYRGSIPIVRDSTWARLIKSHGIPLLVVDKWSTDSLILSISNSTYSGFSPEEIPALWVDYWKNLFFNATHS
jgi:hypothetical protein